MEVEISLQKRVKSNSNLAASVQSLLFPGAMVKLIVSR